MSSIDLPENDLRRTRRARAAVVLAAAALVVASSGTARGQEKTERVATAQGLYDAAAGLIRAGKWADACPKLEESQRLDPALGTQFFLASCYAETGRPTSAWSLFHDVAVAAKAAGHPVRESTARARAAALEPKLPRLTVVVPGDTASIRGLMVQRDGAALGPVVWGTAVPVDLGLHVVRVTAPGRAAWETSVRVDELGQRVEVSVPPLGELPADVSAAPAAAPVVSSSAPPTHDLPGQRRAALAIGGVGVAGLAAGTVLGLLARSAWQQADAACPKHLACSKEAHDQSTRTLSLATGSTIAFVAGGAAVVGGIVLWFTAPTKKPASGVWITPLAAPGVVGALASGVF